MLGAKIAVCPWRLFTKCCAELIEPIAVSLGVAVFEELEIAPMRVADLYGVLDRHLAKTPYLAAGEYGVADMATYPWIARHEWQQVDLAEFPDVKRWYDTIGARPAVVRGMAVPKI